MAIKQRRRKQWAAEILAAGITPLDKVRKLVALGYDEDEADLMVSGVQTGQNQMVYYEQLPNPDYSKDGK